MSLSFFASNVVLLATQAALVFAPRPGAFDWLSRAAAPAWALVPVGSIVAVLFGIQLLPDSASALTYLALIAVPPLAAVALGHAARGGRAWLAPLAAVLFAIAWVERSTLVGDAAAVALSALACVTLGGLLGAVTPLRWLKVGVVLMALADTALIVADQLQAPNDSLNAAAPAADLPQLQRALFGSALMGFGDLFLAGVLGAIVAAQGWPPARAAMLTLAFALAFDLLFFVVDELPATVPIAAALLVLQYLAPNDGAAEHTPILTRSADLAGTGRCARRSPHP